MQLLIRGVFLPRPPQGQNREVRFNIYNQTNLASDLHWRYLGHLTDANMGLLNSASTAINAAARSSLHGLLLNLFDRAGSNGDLGNALPLVLSDNFTDRFEVETQTPNRQWLITFAHTQLVARLEPNIHTGERINIYDLDATLLNVDFGLEN